MNVHNAHQVMKWARADRISDCLVDQFNGWLKEPSDPLEVLAGFLLAFMALTRTMPAVKPRSLTQLIKAVVACLDDVLYDRR